MRIIFLFFSIVLFYNNVLANTLDDVRERGFLKCGISEGLIGFAYPNDKGEWVGFDVDICRALAAAIFGDTEKIEFIVTSSSSRFPMLASGQIDVLARNTTWTFSRDTNLGFEFATSE